MSAPAPAAAPPGGKPPAAEVVAEARRLAVRYPRAGGQVVEAVRGASLQVRAGECVALVGESGCGKTTLGRALLGLLPEGTQTRGEALLEGRDMLRASAEVRRGILGRRAALVFQDPMTRLDPLLRVRGHFAELYAAHGMALDKEEVRLRAARALGEVGVPATRLDAYPHEVSGGQRQRIMIGLALALEPRLVVADEPTTSLDVMVEAQIAELLGRLLRTKGMGLLLITHNLGLVAQLADRVAVMYAGQVVEEAPAAALFARPMHPYTQGLLRSTIHLGTRALASIPGAPPDLARPPPACGFHPRCPRARGVCATSPPPFPDLDGTQARCWFPGPAEGVVPLAPRASWGPPLAHAREVLE